MSEHTFDGKGTLYASSRPGYPEALFAFLRETGLLCADTVAADIGSGTGLFSERLAAYAKTVYAVEPNDDMRRAAKTAFGDRPNLYQIKGDAEHTGLDAVSVDLVTAAQAFHWFDRAAFRRECARILKPNAPVVLVWNVLDEHPLTAQIAALHRTFCPRFKGFSEGMNFETETFADFFTAPPEKNTFANSIFYDKTTFLNRMRSSSFALTEKDEAYTAYLTAFENVFDAAQENGLVRLPYRTLCYVGKIERKEESR